MTIQGLVSITSNLAQSPPSTLPGVGSIYSQQSAQFAVASGTAANQCDTKYVGKLTLAAAPTDLNLQSLTDPFGNSISFARVKSIYIANTSTTDGANVLIGYATTTSNAWTGLVSNPGQIVLCPSTAVNNGVFLALAPNTTGWMVSSTSRLLNFDPGSATIVLNIEICGSSV